MKWERQNIANWLSDGLMRIYFTIGSTFVFMLKIFP